MVILDTDILIGYTRKNQDAIQRIKNLQEKKEILATTIFNVAELKMGCYLMHNVGKGLLKIQQLIDSLDIIYTFSENAVEQFAKISADLQKRGEKIGNMDELIASIVLSENERIITRNEKHFTKVTNLIVNNW